MSKTSDWDHEEQLLRSELEGELDTIRKRHAQDPPREMLAAARAGVLPADVQARVDAQLERDPWSRTIVDGFEQSGAEPVADAAFAERLLKDIKRADMPTRASTVRRRTLFATGGLALAATVLIGVVISRGPRPPQAAPDAPSPAAPSAPVAVPAPPVPAFQIAFTKPDVTWSAGALTWRGAAPGQSFMADVTPALEAYREGDYARAGQALDALAGTYPEAIEVLFYQGLTRMLRDDFSGALAPLTSAERLKNPTFAEDVSWFLAVAEQRTGQTAQARSRLSALCDKGGNRVAEACAAVAGLDAAETQRLTSRPR